jgi:hypothetical protein
MRRKFKRLQDPSSFLRDLAERERLGGLFLLAGEQLRESRTICTGARILLQPSCDHKGQPLRRTLFLPKFPIWIPGPLVVPEPTIPDAPIMD